MRKSIYLILTFVSILVIACTNKDSKENPYEGAWVITYSKFVTPDTTIETTQFPNLAVKLLTKKHYALGMQIETGKIYGGGGEYKYEGDTFISYPKYHSSNSLMDSIIWKSRLEGDQWTISTVYKKDSINNALTEIWKRIIE